MANYASYITLKNGTSVYFSDAALQKSIATGEKNIATSPHSVGEYISIEGTVYKVTKDIAITDAVAVGVNIEPTTIGAEITALNEALKNGGGGMTMKYDSDTEGLIVEQ